MPAIRLKQTQIGPELREQTTPTITLQQSLITPRIVGAGHARDNPQSSTHIQSTRCNPLGNLLPRRPRSPM